MAVSYTGDKNSRRRLPIWRPLPRIPLPLYQRVPLFFLFAVPRYSSCPCFPSSAKGALALFPLLSQGALTFTALSLFQTLFALAILLCSKENALAANNYLYNF